MAAELIVFLTGFTIVASIILIVAYLFFLPQMRKSVPSRIVCTMMLVILCLLQWSHYRYFTGGFNALDSRVYLALLLTAPPMFYCFARSVVYTDPGYTWIQLLHFVLPFLAMVLPVEIVPVVAFLVGTAYTVWFISIIWGMREQRTHFHLELFFFCLFAVMALVALILGLALPYIDPALFYFVYGSSIGIAMVFIVGALIIFPHLISDIMLVADLAYAKSKLTGVDVEAARARLEGLMTHDHIYQNENLNLGQLAELVELTPHQLSELINSSYGMGFPRFMRERRIEVAKRLLIEQADTSILVISMMTGFGSQSNFYTAFKESTGVSPGNYRRNHSSGK